MTKYYAGKPIKPFDRYEESILQGDQVLGKNLSPINYNAKEEIMYHIKGTEKYIEEQKIKDERIYNTHLQIRREITLINIHDLAPCPEGWNPYPHMDEDAMKSMRYSIEEHGIIYPGTVVKRNTEYEILDGNERACVLAIMYQETGNEEYLYFPCYVLEEDEVNDITCREIILETNFGKACTQITKIAVILMRLGIENEKKKHRNDTNVYKKVASDMKISQRTVHNFAILQNASTATLHLLDIGQIDLTAARKLASYNKEVETTIISEFGIKNIRSCMIKALPSPNHIKTEVQVKAVIQIYKTWKHPIKKKVTLEGKYEEVSQIEPLIKEIIKNKNLSSIKIKILNDTFDFTIGYAHLGTKRMEVPEHFLEYLDDV